MVKHVLRDYIYQWRNIKEKRVWQSFYVFAVMSSCVFDSFEECPYVIGVLYLILPTAIAWTLSRMYPNELSLIFHLCPIAIEEKKKYLVTGLWIRILIPVALHLMLTITVIFVGVPISWHVFLDCATFVLAVVTLNLYSQPLEAIVDERAGITGLTESMTICQYTASISLVITAFFIRRNILEGYAAVLGLFWGWGVMTFVASLITCLYMSIRFYSVVISVGAGYIDHIFQKKVKK